MDSNLFHLFGVAAADQQEEGDDVIAEQEQEAVDEEAVGHGHLGNAGSRRSQIYSSKEVYCCGYSQHPQAPFINLKIKDLWGHGPAWELQVALLGHSYDCNSLI